MFGLVDQYSIMMADRHLISEQKNKIRLGGIRAIVNINQVKEDPTIKIIRLG